MRVNAIGSPELSALGRLYADLYVESVKKFVCEIDVTLFEAVLSKVFEAWHIEDPDFVFRRRSGIRNEECV